MTRMVAVVALLLLLASPGGAQDAAIVQDVSTVWRVTPHGDRLIVSRLRVRFATGDEWHEVVGGTLDGITLETSDGPVPRRGQQVRRRGRTISGSDDYVITGRRWATAVVRYVVNPSTPDLPPDAVLAAMQLGASAWSTQAHPNVTLSYAGTITGGTAAYNGRNEVFFRQESPTGAIATTYWWTDSTNTLIDADVVWYDTYRFFVGTDCHDGYFIEDVATHEFGHVLGLSHSLDPAATMVAGTGPCNTEKRTLAEDDIVAIETLYGTAPSPTPKPPKPCRGKKCL